MKDRVVAVVLFGLAAVLYGGVARPTNVATEATLEEMERLEVQRGELRDRLAELESHWGVAPAQDLSPEVAIADLRRDVIRALAETDLTGVQLEVHEGRAPVAAAVAVRARGATRVALSFIDDLAIERGVVLDSVRLSPTPTGAVQLDLQGFRLGGAP